MPVRHTLRWGTHEPVTLQIDDAAWIAPVGGGGSEQGIDDVAAATERAVASPLDFPGLDLATVADDNVAIAIGAGVPRPAAIVDGLIAALRHTSVDLANVSIVVADRATEQLVTSTHGVRVVVHDPRNEEELVYVGEMRGDVTLRLNRALCEADLVLPVGCAHPTGTPQASAFECLFPLFGDAESQARYAQAGSHPGSDLGQRRDEAGWLLGATLAVQVVPQHGDQVAEVLVGTPSHCHQVASARASELWYTRYPRAAKLVVAAVSDRAASWQTFAEVLTMADALRAPGGGVALCVELAEGVGRSLGRLIGEPDVDRVRGAIERDSGPDAAAAVALIRALERGPVYLLSGMASETVEDLGMAPIASLRELERLVARAKSVIAIDEAQHASAQLTTSVAVGKSR